jgi:WD40 repeat protein
MVSRNSPTQSTSAIKLMNLSGFWVCYACIAGFHGAPLQPAPEIPDQRLPMDRPSGPGPTATRMPTDRYGDPLPPGAIARLGTLRFRTLSRFVPHLAFSPDAKLIASSTFEGRVCLWEAATGKLLYRLTPNHNGKLAFTKDGNSLACGGICWNVGDGKEIKPLHDKDLFLPQRKKPLPEGVLAISPDGKFHAGVRGLGTVFVVNRATGKETCTFAGHDHCLQGLAFAPQGGTLATTGEDGKVCLWKIANGQLLHTFVALETQSKYIRSVGFSPDGKILVTAVGDGAKRVQTGLQAWNRVVIRRWNPSQGKELKSWITKEAAFSPTLTVSPVGDTLAFDGGFGNLCLWSFANGKENRRMRDSHLRQCNSLAFAQDGKMLASASDAGVVLWEVVTGQVRKLFRRPSSKATSVAFSPNCKLLAIGDHSGNAASIHVWDLPNDKEKATFLGHKGRISSLAFSRDGAILVSASWDGTVQLWDVSQRKRLQRLMGHDGPVTAMSISPDGKTIASAGLDTTVLIWDMDRIRRDPRRQQK